MSLDKAIKKMLEQKPFFAHFVLNSQILWDKYNVPTAGACVINYTPTLIFNSEFVSKLTLEEFSGLIEHEVNHLIFDHMGQVKYSNMDKEIHNIAADWSINQYISVLPKKGITHEVMEQKLGMSIEREQDSLFYYNLLMKDGNKEKVSGMGPLDDHDLEEVMDKMSLPQDQKIAIRKTVQEALKKAAGNTPGHLKGMLDGLLAPEKLPWQQILRNFVSSAVSSKSLGTRKKMHRRFGLDAPGKKKKRELVLGICRDTSGSVSDELFSGFLQETQGIIKSVGTAFIIDADCEITNIEVLTGQKKKINLERTGYGGTAYGPAIKKCIELKCDAIIYMGDGDCADVPENPGVPFLWVLPEGYGEAPGNFGKVLRI